MENNNDTSNFFQQNWVQLAFTALVFYVVLKSLFSNKTKALVKYSTDRWYWPVLGGYKATDPIGTSRAGGTRRHNGFDIPAPAGTPIVAAEGGIVSAIGTNKDATCGLYVEIWVKKENQIHSYCHLLEVPSLSKGQKIEAGQRIGLIGNTGNSTEDHLHFGVLDLATRKRLDPELFYPDPSHYSDDYRKKKAALAA